MLHAAGVAAVGGVVCLAAMAIYHGLEFGMAFLAR